MKLDRPTKQLIEKYRRQLEHENSADEEAIKEIFKIFPDNKDYKRVLHEISLEDRRLLPPRRGSLTQTT